MKRIILSLAFIMGLGSSAWAQEETSTPSETTETSVDKYDSFKNRHAIGLSAGLPGYGLDYAYNLNRSLNLRAGFLMFNFNDINTDLEVNGQDVNVNANLNSMVYDLMLEYQPSSNYAFKLVAGIGYLDNVGINTLILLNNDIAFGELTIDNEDIGDIDMTIAWSGIAPYMGFGFGRAVPKGRVGFGIEMGAYYAGGPTVDIVASGMLENTDQEAAEMQENLASYAWMPRMMARLVVKL